MASVNSRMASEAVRHRLYLFRYGEGQARRMTQLLRRMAVDVVGRLPYALEESRITADNYTVKRLEAIKAAINPTIQRIYKGIYGQLKADLEALSNGELAYQYQIWREIIPKPVLNFVGGLVEIPETQVWAAANSRPFQGVLLRDIPSLLGDGLTDAIGRAVQQGILQGETYDQITRRVRGSAAAGYKDGVIGTSERNLANVTRSAVSHVAAEARDKIGEANAPLIKSEQWLSTLDNKTSKLCIIRDQLLYMRDKKHTPIGHSVPYGAGPGRLHFNCRSTSTFVFKSWEELGIPGVKIKGASRASMNGQVPIYMDYSSWVERQPMSTLTQVFGVERAQLIRDGKISPPDLFNDKGEYLTLAQLRALDRIPDDD